MLFDYLSGKIARSLQPCSVRLAYGKGALLSSLNQSRVATIQHEIRYSLT
jgi:hypothetical protein